jgi:hypothetical protein
MENKKLLKILTIVNSVNTNRWEYVQKIVEYMPAIEVKEKKWADKFKQENPYLYPLDLSKIEIWSTFDGKCIDLTFSNENDNIRCDVVIYDGYNIYGTINIRFTAILLIHNNFIQEIEDLILWELDEFAEQSYEEYLENKKKLWISNFKNKILDEY